MASGPVYRSAAVVRMAEAPEDQEASAQEWGAWFGTLGDSVVEIGSPFGSSATVSAAGGSQGGSSNLSGFSIVSAGSLEEAAAKVDGCPVLKSGGRVEVYDAPM